MKKQMKTMTIISWIPPPKINAVEIMTSKLA